MSWICFVLENWASRTGRWGLIPREVHKVVLRNGSTVSVDTVMGKCRRHEMGTMEIDLRLHIVFAFFVFTINCQCYCVLDVFFGSNVPQISRTLGNLLTSERTGTRL